MAIRSVPAGAFAGWLAPMLLAACSGSTTPEPATEAPVEAAPEAPRATGPSLVLVTMDTTRADRIGAYGYEAAHTPTVDGLAAQGLRFTRAYAPVPLTIPAHSSIFTGLYPPRHGVHDNGDSVLSDQVTTLAEILQARGYRTAGSAAAFVTTRIWNLDQGFDAYFDEVADPIPGAARWGRERSATSVVDDLVKWFAADRQSGETGPFFIWAHFYDPHEPYAPPAPYDKQFEGRPYDGEIAYVDAQIDRLREAVDQAAGPDGAGWIVLGDHGEALSGEHGEQTHGLFNFEPTAHVPFIVRPARPLPEGRAIDLAVSGADVMPTALGMLGLPVPADLDGFDLSPLLAGKDVQRGPVYIEAETVRDRFGYATEVAIAEGSLKLMATPNPLLFDVVADPGEQTNLLAARPDAVARLQAVRDAVVARKADFQTDLPTPDVFDQLAALGYINTDFSHEGAEPTIDAKDHIETIKALEKARNLASKPAKAAEAARMYSDIIEQEPQIAEAYTGLARALGAQGKLEQAEDAYRAALQLQPESTVVKCNLANNLAGQGRHEEGLALLESVFTQVPGDDLAQTGTLKMLTDLERYDEALTRGRAWLKDDPDNKNIQAHVGIILSKTGNLKAAEPLLLSSLEDGVPRQMVNATLARIALARNDLPAAVEHYQMATTLFPRDLDARVELARILARSDRDDEAAAEYAWLAEAEPENTEYRLGWAQAVFNTADYELAAEVLAPALKASPEDPQVLLLHANILGKIGDHAEAERVFERAKALKKAAPPAPKD